MPSPKGGALNEFHRSVEKFVSQKSLIEQFEKCSLRSDRLSMIKILLDLDPVKKLRIDESYHAKDDQEALKIYEKSLKITGENSSVSEIYLKINFLTRALFAASPKLLAFKEMILERARCWYSVGAFERCMKDCEWFLMIASTKKSERCKESEEEIDRSREIELANGLKNLKTKCAQRLRNLKKNESTKNGKKSTNPQEKANDGNSNKLPKVAGRSNANLKNCSDAIGLKYDKTRGRHLVATRNIKTGSVLIVDEPFASSTDVQALKTNCLHCHLSLGLEENISVPCGNCQTVAYCSEKCRQDSWANCHQFECRIFDYFNETNSAENSLAIAEQRSHLLLTWRTTIVAGIDKNTNFLADDFLNLQICGNGEDNGDREIDLAIDPYDSKDYRTVFGLEAHCKESKIMKNFYRSIRAIFLAKCLDGVLERMKTHPSIHSMDAEKLALVAVAMLRHMQAVDCNAYEIVENSRDPTTKIWEPRNVGGAVYPSVSLVNHSCYPNVVRHSYLKGKVVVRSLRFIPKGVEILDCYGPHFLSESRSSRRRCLEEKYHFSCNCEACTNDYQLPEDSALVFKCPSCEKSMRDEQSPDRCGVCNRAIDVKKLELQLVKSVKKRLAAIGKMLEGNYSDALQGLVEHSNLVDQILAAPNIEAIKTQQSMIQCYNSFAAISPFNNNVSSCK